MQQHYNNSLNIDIVILKSHLKIAIINIIDLQSWLRVSAQFMADDFKGSLL